MKHTIKRCLMVIPFVIAIGMLGVGVYVSWEAMSILAGIIAFGLWAGWALVSLLEGDWDE